MVQEAEEFAEEDKKVREKIEARNALENYVYSMKNTLNDSEKGVADKISRRRQGDHREGARGGERVARRQPGGREGGLRREAQGRPPSPRTSPSVSSSFSVRAARSASFDRSKTDGRFRRAKKPTGAFRRVRSFARLSRAKATSRRRGRDSSLRALQLRLRPQEPTEWPDAASRHQKRAHRTSRRRGGADRARGCSRAARRERRAFAKALGEGAGGDAAVAVPAVARRRSRYRAVVPTRPRSRRPARVLLAGARTLGASLRAHLHVLLQHPRLLRAHGHRWNRERWFGENMPCRDGRDGPLNRVRGADAPGPVLPAKPRGRGPALPRGSSSRRSSSWRFSNATAYQNLRRAARHDHAKRKGRILSLSSKHARRDVALRTGPTHSRCHTPLAPSRCRRASRARSPPRPRVPGRERAAIRAVASAARARRVPSPRPSGRQASRSRTACDGAAVATRAAAALVACAPDAALRGRRLRRPVPDEACPCASRKVRARRLPTRPVARLAFFSRSRTTLTYVASLLGVGERHPSVDAFGRERRKKCSCARVGGPQAPLSSSSEPQSSPSPTRDLPRGLHRSVRGPRSRRTTSTWWAPWFWAARAGFVGSAVGGNVAEKASRCRSWNQKLLKVNAELRREMRRGGHRTVPAHPGSVEVHREVRGQHGRGRRDGVARHHQPQVREAAVEGGDNEGALRDFESRARGDRARETSFNEGWKAARKAHRGMGADARAAREVPEALASMKLVLALAAGRRPRGETDALGSWVRLLRRLAHSRGRRRVLRQVLQLAAGGRANAEAAEREKVRALTN